MAITFCWNVYFNKSIRRWTFVYTFDLLNPISLLRICILLIKAATQDKFVSPLEITSSSVCCCISIHDAARYSSQTLSSTSCTDDRLCWCILSFEWKLVWITVPERLSVEAVLCVWSYVEILERTLLRFQGVSITCSSPNCFLLVIH